MVSRNRTDPAAGASSSPRNRTLKSSMSVIVQGGVPTLASAGLPSAKLKFRPVTRLRNTGSAPHASPVNHSTFSPAWYTASGFCPRTLMLFGYWMMFDANAAFRNAAYCVVVTSVCPSLAVGM